jgi:hypothetical protein
MWRGTRAEPPFIVDSSHPPMPDDFSEHIITPRLVKAGRRNDAVKLFFTKGMGIPPIFVRMMGLLMPGWPKMANMAHAMPYDLAILWVTQTGKPSSVQAPNPALACSLTRNTVHCQVVTTLRS